MAFDSQSSSRTLFERDLGKRVLEDGDEESTFNLANIDIPDSAFSGAFDALGADELLSGIPEPPTALVPMSPRTVAIRANVLRECTKLGKLEFPCGCHLDHISYFCNRSVDANKLGNWADLSNGYRYRAPDPQERVWMMPEYGMHGIPLVLFEYGFRLPMHPFHLAFFEAVGCGIAQLVPNAMAQISGFIALCVEKNRVPSMKLFLSIYGVRYSGGQVYVDTHNGRSKIVNVKSSNSGYHPRWVYFYGPDL